jgi:hypothetical protein
MSNEQINNAVVFLKGELANNPLADADDTLNYWQYAARLSALGEPELLQKTMSSVNTADWTDVLRKRCQRGICEIKEYEGDDLALSIIDAQDFSLFETRSEGRFSELQPYFAAWRDVCEYVPLDEDAADLLRGFNAVFQLPEDEILPVITHPLTETDYALLREIYKDVQLPVIDCPLTPSQITKIGKNLYNTDTKKYVTRPTLLLAAADGNPDHQLKAMLSTDGTVKIRNESFRIETQLDDAWQLYIEIKSDIPVDRVRLGNIPAFQEMEDNNLWCVRLKKFTDNTRREFLEQSLFVQLCNGYRIKCFLSFL